MILVVSLLSFVTWVYLVGFRGFFWMSSQVLPIRKPSGKAKVFVVIPARNEAASILQSLDSLLHQDYPGELFIIVVDDNSTDGTGAFAASLTTDGRLTVLHGQPLKEGWSGKLWAVHQGLEHEQAKTADFVLLTDADVIHAPEHLSTLVAKAEAENLDLVSELVLLHCDTWAERR